METVTSCSCLSLSHQNGISSGVHRIGDAQGVSAGAIGIGVHQETHHNPLVLHGLPRFLRIRHCGAGEGGVGGADEGNPAGGEVLGDGDGGGGGGELRGVPVRVRGRGRDQTADELSPHIPQRVSGPLDGVRSKNVPPVSDTLHTPPYASCILLQSSLDWPLFLFSGSSVKGDNNVAEET
ncbi:hypothetical protein JHK85_002612 [Glycine max]|nr:hypothetical protein JHK85_002612 [Glycine max]KAG5089934.1 hypothetical protein JHK86_002546 [Glycine max]